MTAHTPLQPSGLWPGGLSDIAGLRVGHCTRDTDGWLTGVTAVIPPPGTIGGVDVRGGGPGTHETDALDPRTLIDTVDAVTLTGGSAFGLVSAHGVQQWCYEHGFGAPVGHDPRSVVPIVPAAAIFDLREGPSFRKTPDIEMGYQAAVAAADSVVGEPIAQGNIGAGTGARVHARAYRGGLGTASMTLDVVNQDQHISVVVAALAVVNAHGTPLAPDASLAPLRTMSSSETTPFNTTIGVIATDAKLTADETSRLATVAHDGYARALDPVHTLTDGDTVFALATGEKDVVGAAFGTRTTNVMQIQATAAEVMRRAILNGVGAATPVLIDGERLLPFPLGATSH